MTLKAISSLGSARKNFSWTRRTSCLESRNQTLLGSGGQNESNSHQLARIGSNRRAIGYKTRFDLLNPKTFDSYFPDMMYVEFMKNFLLADSSELMGVRLLLISWAQNQTFLENFSWTRRTSCLESRNQTFLAQEAEMSLTAISSLQSARIFHELDVHQIKWNESNCHQLARIGEKKIFHELDVHHV